MKEIGARRVTPALRPEDGDMPLLPWIDPENFNLGYLMRACTFCRSGQQTRVATHPGLLDRERHVPGH
jgi:hypothetical protein